MTDGAHMLGDPWCGLCHGPCRWEGQKTGHPLSWEDYTNNRCGNCKWWKSFAGDHGDCQFPKPALPYWLIVHEPFMVTAADGIGCATFTQTINEGERMIGAEIEIGVPFKKSDVGNDGICLRLATITIRVPVYASPNRTHIQGSFANVIGAIESQVGGLLNPKDNEPMESSGLSIKLFP